MYMADKSFDVVIVGGGNKALIAAMYLTKYAKLEVGIFEERHELGGGWCQEEPAAGFIGNVCSTAMYAPYHMIWSVHSRRADIAYKTSSRLLLTPATPQLMPLLKYPDFQFCILGEIHRRDQGLITPSDNYYIKTFIRHVHPPFLIFCNCSVPLFFSNNC